MAVALLIVGVGGVGSEIAVWLKLYILLVITNTPEVYSVSKCLTRGWMP